MADKYKHSKELWARMEFALNTIHEFCDNVVIVADVVDEDTTFTFTRWDGNRNAVIGMLDYARAKELGEGYIVGADGEEY